MKLSAVLNTRPREQAAELTRLLENAGLYAIEAPAIATVPAWDALELARARSDRRAGRFDWVVLPSVNAATQLRDDLPGVKLVCGAATGETLGLRPTIALDRFSARAALEALKPLVRPGQSVLVPHAAEGRDDLIDGLRLTGLDVFAPIAYRTIPVEDAAARLRAGGVDVLTLCSPSAAASVNGAVDESVRIVCLGATTADQARRAGMRVDAVALHTTMAALVEAVEAVLGGVQV